MTIQKALKLAKDLTGTIFLINRAELRSAALLLRHDKVETVHLLKLRFKNVEEKWDKFKILLDNYNMASVEYIPCLYESFNTGILT